jgi:hypothetical protein
MLTKLLSEAVNIRVSYRNVKQLYGKYVEVESSNIHSMLYLPQQKILRVRFKGDNKQKGELATFGAEYEYYRVPIRIFILLLNAPSHGSEFWKSIRSRFKYARLADWDEDEYDDYQEDEEDEEDEI